MRPSEHDVEAALVANGADVLRYLQRRAGEDAADVFGATMLVAWGRRSHMPAGPESARRWLFGIARMTLKGNARAEARRLRLTARVRDTLTPPPEADHPTTLDVRLAIASLPEAQAELVRLVHWEGFSLADSTQVMWLNSSTARGRYQKAREALVGLLAVTAEHGPGLLSSSAPGHAVRRFRALEPFQRAEVFHRSTASCSANTVGDGSITLCASSPGCRPHEELSMSTSQRTATAFHAQNY